MKNYLLFLFLLLSGAFVRAQDCGGIVTGMDVSVLSTSALHVQFYRPLEPEKYWDNKNVPEYEAYFQINYRVYFNQAARPDWVKDIDTSVIQVPFQITATDHSSSFDLKGLTPGLSYEVCIYTRCGQNLVGPLCHFATTTTESPCKLEFKQNSATSGNFKFIYNAFTNVLEKKITFEYRENSENWTVVDVISGNGVFIDNLKPGATYFARVKFQYYNDVESNYSDILMVVMSSEAF
ncbi:MAG: hypothetical protein WCQ95_03465 [Bacteroidota bacterium]